MEKHLTYPADGTLERIRADLKAQPPTSIVLAYGTPAFSVTYLALYMTFAGVAREKPVVYLDGANSFNPFIITRIARKMGLSSEDLLKRIHISRAFTCHQMQALVTDRLEDAFRRFNTNVAVVSGLLDTFYDEDVPFGEAYDLLKAATTEFTRLAGKGARILIACPDSRLPLEARRRRFMDHLIQTASTVLRSEGNDGKARFVLEKPGRKLYERLRLPEPPRHYQHQWNWR
ncbi:MAG: hypothetical protein Kow0099_18530 [Candidatus Abyssubacteria bacterium]